MRRWIITLDTEAMAKKGASPSQIAQLIEDVAKGLEFMVSGYTEFMAVSLAVDSVAEVIADISLNDPDFCETCEIEGKHHCDEHAGDDADDPFGLGEER